MLFYLPTLFYEFFSHFKNGLIWFPWNIATYTQKLATQLRTFHSKFQPFCCYFFFFQEKLQNPETRRVHNESAGRALAVAFPDVLLQLGLSK